MLIAYSHGREWWNIFCAFRLPSVRYSTLSPWLSFVSCYSFNPALMSNCNSASLLWLLLCRRGAKINLVHKPYLAPQRQHYGAALSIMLCGSASQTEIEQGFREASRCHEFLKPINYFQRASERDAGSFYIARVPYTQNIRHPSNN